MGIKGANLFKVKYSLIRKKIILGSTTKIELIPSAQLLLDFPHHTFRTSDYSCPKGAKPFRVNQENPQAPLFVTCNCEDHCSWYKCRLETPPSKCLEGTKNFWKWDNISNYWVAQMNQGNTGIIFCSKHLIINYFVRKK